MITVRMQDLGAPKKVRVHRKWSYPRSVKIITIDQFCLHARRLLCRNSLTDRELVQWLLATPIGESIGIGNVRFWLEKK